LATPWRRHASPRVESVSEGAVAPRPIVILGTAPNCIDVYEAIEEINSARRRDGAPPAFECRGFLDDDARLEGKDVVGLPVLGPLTAATGLTDVWFVNGIGSQRTFVHKEAIIARTGIPRERFATIIHPSASVSPRARLGAGVVLLQNVAVAADVVLGDHVIVFPGSVISHHSHVADYGCVAVGVLVSGAVTVGKSCYLGTGSVIREQITIGERCLIGMGSVVIRDVGDDSVVVGNPARFLRHVSDAP
jgi:sugar O-acyltransferase (sialic acid O-acetyltransferase NeuD family)